MSLRHADENHLHSPSFKHTIILKCRVFFESTIMSMKAKGTKVKGMEAKGMEESEWKKSEWKQRESN